MQNVYVVLCTSALQRTVERLQGYTFIRHGLRELIGPGKLWYIVVREMYISRPRKWHLLVRKLYILVVQIAMIVRKLDIG